MTEPLNEAQIIFNLRQDDDRSAQYYAAWWLGKMRSSHPEAVPLLLSTLQCLEKQPVDPERRGVALNAIRALGRIQDQSASPALLRLLSSSDYSVREEAARSLGSMRKPEAIAPIIRLLKNAPTDARLEPSSTHQLQEPCEALLEALGDIGIHNTDVVGVITPFTEHQRPLIRASACRALLQLTNEASWGGELVRLLQHPEPLVRRGALLDLGATGWRPSVSSIMSAAVESSLKLVALRGIAEKTDDASVLDAMDHLL